MIAQTGSSGTTVTILPNGETRLSSNDPWYRLFRALADLYLTGEIDIDQLAEQSTQWLSSGPQIDRLREMYPAAVALEGKIALAWMEPDCLCDIYRETACGCSPIDRRERLRELIGGPLCP